MSACHCTSSIPPSIALINLQNFSRQISDFPTENVIGLFLNMQQIIQIFISLFSSFASSYLILAYILFFLNPYWVVLSAVI